MSQTRAEEAVTTRVGIVVTSDFQEDRALFFLAVEVAGPA